MQATTIKRSLLGRHGGRRSRRGLRKIWQRGRRPAEAIATPLAPAAAPPARLARAARHQRHRRQCGWAVVNISVSGRQKTGHGSDPTIRCSSSSVAFGTPQPQERGPARGMGSGFIVSSRRADPDQRPRRRDADEVTVKLTDKREFKAKVVGLDKLTDIAVLRIDAKDLPVVRLGDPVRARVGEWVVAIGSPFGFENSVTAGIVSAKSRSLASDSYVPFIQTDVAINPGNSGGPLLNLDGEVIGINSQIYSRSGGYQGVSFAIPIDVAMNIKEQLLQHGKVSHGRLGVTIQEVSQSLAESFGLKSTAGALISSVEKGSPAAAAGLEAR
jgi:serine protease Do